MEKPRALIVEDDPDTLTLRADSLTKTGRRTVIGDSGEAGLETFGTHHPDLVILDIMLPGIGSREVLRQLKRGILTSGTPVIMLTAVDTDAGEMRAHEHGTDCCVTKPFNIERLLPVVGKTTAAQGP